MKYFKVKLAIIGHETRNKEILTILEDFGGKNHQALTAKDEYSVYFINNDFDREEDSETIYAYPTDGMAETDFIITNVDALTKMHRFTIKTFCEWRKPADISFNGTICDLIHELEILYHAYEGYDMEILVDYNHVYGNDETVFDSEYLDYLLWNLKEKGLLNVASTTQMSM